MFDRISPEDVVADLATTDCDVLSDRELIGVLTHTASVVAWAESMGLAAAAQLRSRRRSEFQSLAAESSAWRGRQGRPPALPVDEDEVDRFCASEIAVALRVSQRSAMQRLVLADDLVHHLPATMRELGSGRIGLSHARAVRDATSGVHEPTLAWVEGHVLPSARERTPAQLGADTRRAVMRVDPEAAGQRCVAARAARRVDTWGLPDGVAALQVTGPAETVAAAWARVDALAREAQDTARSAMSGVEAADPAGPGRVSEPSPPAVATLDQCRADTVLRLLAGTHDLLVAPSSHVAVHVDVVVPLGTALGLADEPAELTGVGPLPVDVARRLLGAATRVAVAASDDVPGRQGEPDDGGAHDSVDAAGAATHPDTTVRRDLGSYRPPAALARTVRLRDTTCRFPGCRRRASACDVDHTVAYPLGPTAACNLACLCRSHHRLKHRGGWQVEQLGGGRLRWTSPTGHTRTTDPPSWTGAPRPPPQLAIG